MAETTATVLEVTEFLNACIKVGIAETQQLYVGIDPGATGAIAFVWGKQHLAIDIPTFKVAVVRKRRLSKDEQETTGRKTRSVDGTTSKYHYKEIVEVFESLADLDPIVCLEKVPPTTGMGGYGDALAYASYMMWPLYLVSKGFRIEEIAPAVWKETFSLNAKRGKKGDPKISRSKRSAMAKAASRQKAQMLFPRADLDLSKNHGRAEALLIVEHVRRQYGYR